MAKPIALLEYTFIFDPSETWSSGYQFEKTLADYYGAHGVEAEIIPTQGGTGRRVIYLTAIQIPEAKPVKQETKPVKIEPKTPPENYKKFVKPQQQQDSNIPKLSYKRPVSNLRQDIHALPRVRFRKGKR